MIVIGIKASDVAVLYRRYGCAVGRTQRAVAAHAVGSSSEVSHRSRQKDTLNSNCFLLQAQLGKIWLESRQKECLSFTLPSQHCFLRLKRALWATGLNM